MCRLGAERLWTADTGAISPVFEAKTKSLMTSCFVTEASWLLVLLQHHVVTDSLI